MNNTKNKLTNIDKLQYLAELINDEIYDIQTNDDFKWLRSKDDFKWVRSKDNPEFRQLDSRIDLIYELLSKMDKIFDLVREQYIEKP